MLKVNLEDLEKVLPYYYKLRQSLYLWGKPSSGKTSMIRQFAQQKARELGLEYSEQKFGEKYFTCKILILSQMDSPDLRGMPELTSGEGNLKITKFVPSEELPRNGQGIIFFDELNLAGDDVRAACMQYILEGTYGVLPRLKDKNGSDSFWRVAASNSEQDYCAVNTTSMALLRRFCHLEVEPELDEILKYMYDNNLDSRISAYLKNFPEDLWPRVWDEKLLDKKANPFPYTWDIAARLIEGVQSKTDLIHLVASCVGEEVAVRFHAFCKLIGKLDINRLIRKPQNEISEIAKSDEKASLYYAIVSSLTSYWYQKNKSLTAKKVIQIAALLPPEYAVAFLKFVLRKRGNQLKALPETNVLARNLGIYLEEDDEEKDK